MASRSTKTAKPYTAKVTQQVTEPVDNAYVVGKTIHDGVTAAGTAIADSVGFVGNKIINFGKGLFNVHTAH